MKDIVLESKVYGRFQQVSSALLPDVSTGG
jgi:hypothetical protein